MKKKRKSYKVPHRTMLTTAGTLILLLVMIASSKPQIGTAAPGDLTSATNKYPNIASSMLNTCDLCHTASIPQLNPYGAAYKANGRNVAAFGAIENLDSDGDGFTNIQELNALTFPGNASSFPVVPTATNTPIQTSTPPAATATTPPTTSANVTVGLSQSSIAVGASSTVMVSLNNVPAGGYASAEFTCTYNATLVDVSAITETSLFGADPVTVVNGPQNGSFIFAIAGSKGNKATTDGGAFTFSATGLQAGQSAIDCQARVSTGNLVLQSLPSTPANLNITSSSSQQGTFTGQVLAGKSVTVTMYDVNNVVAGTTTTNADGTFNLQMNAGTYTAVASAPGYLRGQGAVTITSGGTTTFQPLNLLAGDIDGNDVIDQFDALTIGINYNGTAPTEADLNNDGTINVLDLEILALNYRQTGPLPWQ